MEKYPIEECEQLFMALFPLGFAGSDVADTLAPDGWEKSPYVLAFHPTVEQAYERHVESHESIMHLLALSKSEKIITLESFEDFKLDYKIGEIHPEIELQEIVAACVWDIFSDNNDVVKDNKVYDIGSFRGAARCIANWLNRTSEKKYDYIDFYMGSFGRSDFCDLTPIYELIFSRLKQVDCDWILHFTQMNLIDFSNNTNQKPSNPENYNPNEALAQELKQQEEQKAKDDFKEQLEDINAKQKDDALYKPPPPVVQAYLNVFGKFPIRWPPL